MSGRYRHLLFFYIILQPLIDLSASLSERFGIQWLSFGSGLRLFFLLFGGIIVFFKLLKDGNRSLFIVFVLPFIAVCLMLAVNLVQKHPFYFADELQFAAKSVYYVVCLFVFHFFLDTKRAVKPVTVAALIYGLSFIMAIATHTGFPSYNFNGKGTTGWFYAANEIGATLAFLLCFSLLYAQKREWAWAAVLSVLMAMYAIGTKTAFLSALFLLVLATGYLWFKKVKRKWGILFLTILFIGAAPFSPFIQNLRHPAYIPPLEPEPQTAPSTEVSEKAPHYLEENPILRRIFSSRTYYFEKKLADYHDVSPLRKWFGMGYAGDYKDHQPKLVEMDVIDLWIGYGWIGVIFMLCPLAVWLIGVIRGYRRWKKLGFYRWMLTVTVLLGLGISVISGHVLFAPAVSFFFSLALHGVKASLPNVEDGNVASK